MLDSSTANKTSEGNAEGNVELIFFFVSLAIYFAIFVVMFDFGTAHTDFLTAKYAEKSNVRSFGIHGASKKSFSFSAP